MGRLIRSIALLVVVFVLAGPGQATPLKMAPVAATVFGYATSGINQEKHAYTNSDAAAWEVVQVPFDASLITLDKSNPGTIGSDEGKLFWNTLDSFGGGWTFSVGATDLLDDSYIIKTADPEHGRIPNDQNCQINHPLCVGMEFHASYDDKGTNPDSIHWIQVVYDTFTGAVFTGVDNLGAASPYYDHFGAADGTDFYDHPRIDGLDNRALFFEAYLFAVTGPAASSPGAVTVLPQGVFWGFTVVPEPSTAVLIGIGLFGFALRRRTP